jgi:hypothetical protein
MFQAEKTGAMEMANVGYNISVINVRIGVGASGKPFLRKSLEVQG